VSTANLKIDEAIFLNREVSDFKPFLLELAAGIQHALVLLKKIDHARKLKDRGQECGAIKEMKK
jgi:hypothetical protein